MERRAPLGLNVASKRRTEAQAPGGIFAKANDGPARTSNRPPLPGSSGRSTGGHRAGFRLVTRPFRDPFQPIGPGESMLSGITAFAPCRRAGGLLNDPQAAIAMDIPAPIFVPIVQDEMRHARGLSLMVQAQEFTRCVVAETGWPWIDAWDCLRDLPDYDLHNLFTPDGWGVLARMLNLNPVGFLKARIH
jgi:hypothetical protein